MTTQVNVAAEASLRALELLVRHVRAVNATSRGEGADDLDAGITDDCLMRFEGIPVGPSRDASRWSPRTRRARRGQKSSCSTPRS